MSRTPSVMLELGTLAPTFSLPDPEGTVYSLEDFREAKGLLVIFMCNHCPFVVNIRHALAAFAHDYMPLGLAVVGINANDVAQYPQDSPDRMRDEIRRVGYPFPYLYDASQDVAKAYRAACTPDFFLFDGDRRLVYRGQFDGSRPGNGVIPTGADLRSAASALLEGRPIDVRQIASIGCNIKWKPGNEPAYARA